MNRQKKNSNEIKKNGSKQLWIVSSIAVSSVLIVVVIAVTAVLLLRKKNSITSSTFTSTNNSIATSVDNYPGFWSNFVTSGTTTLLQNLNSFNLYDRGTNGIDAKLDRPGTNLIFTEIIVSNTPVGTRYYTIKNNAGSYFYPVSASSLVFNTHAVDDTVIWGFSKRSGGFYLVRNKGTGSYLQWTSSNFVNLTDGQDVSDHQLGWRLPKL